MTDFVCGTGGWTGPKPGDPDNNSILTAAPAFGGIDVSWTYPATNPYAVAHTLLFRGTSSNFAASMQRAVVAGNFFYDKLDTGITYYYWIRIVSVNGTIGDLIGPASATARPLIADLIEQLSGQIEASSLGQSLRSHIGDITTHYGELRQEILDRIAGEETLSFAQSDIQEGVAQTLAFIGQELTTRANDDSALAQEIETVAVISRNAAVAITTEKQARIDADGAFGHVVNGVFVASKEVAAAVTDITDAKVGYASIMGSESVPYDGDRNTVVYSVAKYPTADYPDYAVNRKLIIDAVGVTEWNATLAGVAKPLVWLVGLPLASAIKSVGISDDGGLTYMTIEQRATAQKKTNGDLYGQWSVKIDAGGRVAGFGLSSTLPKESGTNPVSRFIVNADTFSISKPLDFASETQPNSTVIGKTWFNEVNQQIYKYSGITWIPYVPISPFIVDNDTGETFIDEAVINHLTFSKLRDESGSFIVANGKVKADYIDAVELRLPMGGVVEFDAAVANTTLATVSDLNANANAYAISHNNQISAISADGVISVGSEQDTILIFYNEIVENRASLLSLVGQSPASAAVIAAQSAYQTSYDCLVTYWPSCNIPARDAPLYVTAVDFNWLFATVYSGRKDLLGALQTSLTNAIASNIQATSALTPITGLTTAGKNVLTGAGGIKVGTINWDDDGNTNIGYGVGITAKGIAARNKLDATTFVLDATTGKLTINEIDVIGTSNIRDHQVTSNQAIFLAADVSTPDDSVYLTSVGTDYGNGSVLLQLNCPGPYDTWMSGYSSDDIQTHTNTYSIYVVGTGGYTLIKTCTGPISFLNTPSATWAQPWHYEVHIKKTSLYIVGPALTTENTFLLVTGMLK